MEFGHHPEPAVDFCPEVDAIEQEIIDRKAGLPPTMDLGARIERAMQFKVGGDSKAVAAKRDLRLIETAFEAGVAGGQTRRLLARRWLEIRPGPRREGQARA